MMSLMMADVKPKLVVWKSVLWSCVGLCKYRILYTNRVVILKAEQTPKATNSFLLQFDP